MSDVQRTNGTVQPRALGWSAIFPNAQFNRAPKGSASPHRSRASLRGAVKRIVIGLVTAVVMFSTAACLSAAPPAGKTRSGILVEPRPLSFQARSDAVVPLDWKITWNGTGLLEGRLQVVLLDNGQRLGTIITDEMAIQPGDHEFRTMLPPLEPLFGTGQVTARLSFLSGSRSISLGNRILRVPPVSQRIFVTCLCTPSDRWDSPGLALLERSLRFERFDPAPNARELVTTAAFLEPERMPNQPLGYCGFDLVILTGRGLAALRTSQLTALRQWAAAGGSLLIHPTGLLEPRHVKFLNELFGTDSDQTPFSLDENGHLIDAKNTPATKQSFATGNGPRVRLRRIGLGRIALTTQPKLTAADFKTETWKRTVWFLWKMQRRWLKPILQQGHWETTQNRQRTARFPNMGVPASYQGAFGAIHQPYGQWLFRQLMPETVKVVPLSLVGLLLGLYVLVVGPVDYIVLGRLKRRKLTWVVFPVVTFGFAGSLVWLSNSYLHSQSAGRAIVVIDIGDKGEVLRENRFSLLFTNTTRTVETPVQRGMLTPLNRDDFAAAAMTLQSGINRTGFGGPPSRGRRTSGADALVGPAFYSGRLPSHYTVIQRLPQWTPMLNRTFSIAPTGYDIKVDWSFFSLHPHNFVAPWRLHPTARQRVAGQVAAAFGEQAAVDLVCSRFAMHIGGPNLLDVVSWNRNANANSEPQTLAKFESPFLQRICGEPGTGLFHLVSRVSPSGGRSLEDIALLDTTNPSKWLLLVTVKREHEMVIYRKLYRGAD